MADPPLLPLPALPRDRPDDDWALDFWAPLPRPPRLLPDFEEVLDLDLADEPPDFWDALDFRDEPDPDCDELDL